MTQEEINAVITQLTEYEDSGAASVDWSSNDYIGHLEWLTTNIEPEENIREALTSVGIDFEPIQKVSSINSYYAVIAVDDEGVSRDLRAIGEFNDNQFAFKVVIRRSRNVLTRTSVFFRDKTTAENVASLISASYANDPSFKECNIYQLSEVESKTGMRIKAEVDGVIFKTQHPVYFRNRDTGKQIDLPPIYLHI